MRKLAAYTVVRLASALSWKPPANRVKELFPATADATSRNADPNAVFVVTGASGGIGSTIVEQLHERTAGTIYACCRDATKAPALDRVRPVPLDVCDDASIAALPDTVGARVDALWNVGGVLHEGDRGPERSLDAVDREWLLKSVDVNCAGPILVTKTLRKALNAGRRGGANARPASVVANLSARVGSIADNGLGGWYSYRLSKAALNQATVTCARELKRQRTICVALHPGTTDTGLSKPFQARVAPEKLFPVEFTASQLLDIVDGLEEDDSGRFIDWAGIDVEY
jgi:NAD(P)-dependent dehydrogenase (short-subunit alcohol dehydrogenase family)